MLMILPCNKKPFDDKTHIKSKSFTIHFASHDFDHLFRKFEISFLKSEVVSRGNIKDKPKVYMN